MQEIRQPDIWISSCSSKKARASSHSSIWSHFKKMSEWGIESKLEETGPSKLSTLSSKEVLMPSASRKSRQVTTFLWLSTLAQAPILDNLSRSVLQYLRWTPGDGLCQERKRNQSYPSIPAFYPLCHIYLWAGNWKLIFPLITVLCNLEEHNIKRWAEYRWIWTHYTSELYTRMCKTEPYNYSIWNLSLLELSGWAI